MENKESKPIPDWRKELDLFADLECLENEEMWASRVIDEHSRKQSILGVIIQLTHQDDSAKS
jgi:hypothetical protein